MSNSGENITPLHRNTPQTEKMLRERRLDSLLARIATFRDSRNVTQDEIKPLKQAYVGTDIAELEEMVLSMPADWSQNRTKLIISVATADVLRQKYHERTTNFAQQFVNKLRGFFNDASNGYIDMRASVSAQSDAELERFLEDERENPDTYGKMTVYLVSEEYIRREMKKDLERTGPGY